MDAVQVEPVVPTKGLTAGRDVDSGCIIQL